MVNNTGPSMMFFYERVETENSHSDIIILQQVMLRIEDEFALGLSQSNSFSILKKNNKRFEYFI